MKEKGESLGTSVRAEAEAAIAGDEPASDGSEAGAAKVVASEAITVHPPATTAASSPPPQSQYRDRALERRAAFGVDESALKEAKRAKRYHPYEQQQARTFVPGPEAPPPSTGALPPAAAEPQPAGGRALDTSNVGHAMLLAMGWTAGSGLGEGDRQGRVEPVEAALSHLGGEERAGIGAAAGRERTTMPPGAVAWQTSMLEQAREARRRRYEASGGDEGEKELKSEEGR